MRKLLGLFAAVALLFGAGGANADLYRVESGSFVMNLGPNFYSVTSPFLQGSVVEGTVSGNQLQTLNFPNIIVASKGAIFQLNGFTTLNPTFGTPNMGYGGAPTGNAMTAKVTMFNAQGGPGFQQNGVSAKTKIMGYVTANVQNPNGYPTMQNFGTPFNGITYPTGAPGTNLTAGYAYRIGNLGGFIQSTGGFGGPLGLIGGAFVISEGSTLTVDLGVFGQYITINSGGNIGQALSWATGNVQARAKKGDAGAFFGPTKAYVTAGGAGYAFGGVPYGTAYDGSTGAGASGKVTAMGSPVVVGSDPGGAGPAVIVTFSTAGNATGGANVTVGAQTVTMSLVQPAIYNPGIALGIVGTLNFSLRQIVPEPGTALLLGVGVIGLAAVGRKRSN